MVMSTRSQSMEARRDSFKDRDEEPIIIPPVKTSDLLHRFQKTLIGRIFHEGRSMSAILSFLPRPQIWNVEGRVRGLDLGNGRFQFDFDHEEDMHRVLNKRPCHFNKWHIALERWVPDSKTDFPSTITFWVKVKNLPPEYWNENTFKAIGKPLGTVGKINEREVKFQVTIDATKPLQFSKKAQCPDGKEVMVFLFYENLKNHCLTCGMLSQEEENCPELTEEERNQKRIEKASLMRVFYEDSNRYRFEIHFENQTKKLLPSREAPSRAHYDQATGSESRERRGVWNRLEIVNESPIKQRRDAPGRSVRDLRKRRYEESVATSSWHPKSPQYRDEDDRRKNWKIHKTSPPRRPPSYHHRETHFPSVRNSRSHPQGQNYTAHNSRIWDSRLHSSATHSSYERDRDCNVVNREYRPEKNRDINREEASNIGKQQLFESKNRLGETVYYHEKSASSSKVKDTLSLPKKSLSPRTVRVEEREEVVPAPSKNLLCSTQAKRVETFLDSTQIPETIMEEQEQGQIMSKEDIDNDDLFEDEELLSMERTISDPIPHPSPMDIVSNRKSHGSGSSKGTKNPSSSQRRPAAERLDYPKFQVPKGVHRKSRSDHKLKKIRTLRDLTGMASKKRNALLTTASPKVKLSPRRRFGRSSTNSGPETKRNSSTTSRSLFPRHEVLPSAISKKSSIPSGSVGLQKPPSKNR